MTSLGQGLCYVPSSCLKALGTSSYSTHRLVSLRESLLICATVFGKPLGPQSVSWPEPLSAATVMPYFPHTSFLGAA